MENKQCILCGSVMEYKEGVKKETGKAWKGYFCQNKDCGKVDWIKTQPQKSGGFSKVEKPQTDYNFQTHVIDELANLNRRLDGMSKSLTIMANFLNEKLGKQSYAPTLEEQIGENVEEIPFK